jgi:hypothetical protein
MRRTLPLLASFLCAGVCSAEDSVPLPVADSECGQYWQIAQDLMPPAMPPIVAAAGEIVKQRSRVILDYEVTINENGVPVDFQFKSIEPADVDPRPFTASIMFYRYRPAPGNAQRQPIRLHGPRVFFMPEKTPD